MQRKQCLTRIIFCLIIVLQFSSFSKSTECYMNAMPYLYGGDSSSQEYWPYSGDTDDLGNLYLCGDYYTSSSSGTIFVIKIDSTMTEVWRKGYQYQTEYLDNYAFGASPSGTYLAHSHYYSDGLMILFTGSNGKLLSAKYMYQVRPNWYHRIELNDDGDLWFVHNVQECCYYQKTYLLKLTDQMQTVEISKELTNYRLYMPYFTTNTYYIVAGIYDSTNGYYLSAVMTTNSFEVVLTDQLIYQGTNNMWLGEMVTADLTNGYSRVLGWAWPQSSSDQYIYYYDIPKQSTYITSSITQRIWQFTNFYSLYGDGWENCMRPIGTDSFISVWMTNFYDETFYSWVDILYVYTFTIPTSGTTATMKVVGVDESPDGYLEIYGFLVNSINDYYLFGVTCGFEGISYDYCQLYSWWKPYESNSCFSNNTEYTVTGSEVTGTSDISWSTTQQFSSADMTTTITWIDYYTDIDFDLTIVTQTGPSGSCWEGYMSDMTTTNNVASVQVYYLSSSQLSIKLNDFTYSYSCTSLTYTYSYSISVNGSSTLPAFLTLDSTNQYLKVYTTNSTYMGSYSISVIATAPDASTLSYSFTLTITQSNSAPVFTSSLEAATVEVNSVIYYKLPTVSDSQNDLYTITATRLDGSSLPTFVYFDGSNRFKIAPTLLSQAGMYTFLVTITDRNAIPLSTGYWMTLIVTSPPAPENPTVDTTTDITVIDQDSSSTTTTDDTSSSTTDEEYSDDEDFDFDDEDIDFTDETLEDSSDESSSEGESSDNSTNSTDGSSSDGGSSFSGVSSSGYNAQKVKSKTLTDKKTGLKLRVVTSGASPKLTASVKTVSMLGLVTVKFSESIVTPANYTKYNTKFLRVQVIPNDDAMKDQLGLNSWQLVDFRSDEMDIQLNFTNPLLISTSLTKDKISVTFLANGNFITQSDKRAIQYKYNCQGEIPVQLVMTSNLKVCSQSIIEALEAMGSLAQAGSKVNVSFPTLGNDIVNFKIIPTDQIMDKMFAFGDSITASLGSTFQTAGYGSPNLIKNLGILILALLGLIGLLMLLYVFRILKHRYTLVERLYDYIRKAIFYNAIIRAILESYLKFCISAAIGATTMTLANWVTTLNGVISVLMLIVLSLIPIQIYVFVRVFKKRLTDPVIIQKYGSLYQGVDLEIANSTLMTVFFVTRRLTFALSLVMFSNSTVTQLFIQFFGCQLLIYFFIWVRPMDTLFFNSMEIFNEVCLLCVSYFLFCFTDFVPDPTQKYALGWPFIGFVAFNIFVNWIAIVYKTVSTLITKFKIWNRNRKRKISETVQIQNLKVQNNNNLSINIESNSSIANIVTGDLGYKVKKLKPQTTKRISKPQVSKPQQLQKYSKILKLTPITPEYGDTTEVEQQLQPQKSIILEKKNTNYGSVDLNESQSLQPLFLNDLTTIENDLQLENFEIIENDQQLPSNITVDDIENDLDKGLENIQNEEYEINTFRMQINKGEMPTLLYQSQENFQGFNNEQEVQISNMEDDIQIQTNVENQIQDSNLDNDIQLENIDNVDNDQNIEILQNIATDENIQIDENKENMDNTVNDLEKQNEINETEQDNKSDSDDDIKYIYSHLK